MDTIQGNVTGKACYSVRDFCAAHSISRAMFYKLKAEGAEDNVCRQPDIDLL